MGLPVAGENVTLASRTIGNALAGVIGFGWLTVLALTTTPYIVHKLGNDAYGILALVTSVLGFFAFLDLGMTNAAVKYIAESYALNDIKGISKIISSSLVVFLGVGVLGGVLIVLSTDILIQRLLKIPAEYLSDSRFTFYIAACGFVLNMGSAVFASIPRAIQRYYLSTIVSMCVGTSLTLSMVLILYLGYGLKHVVILNFISSVISLCAYVLIAKRYLKGLTLGLHFDPALFAKLFRFGFYSLLVILSATVCYQLDRVLIGSFLGSAAVAFYVVPASLAAAIRNIDVSLMGVVFPLCSQLSARGEFDKMRELFLKAGKYAFIVVISLATPIIILSTKIMTIWMGPEYGSKSSWVLAILVLTTVFNSVTTAPFYILDGSGMPGVNAKFSMLSAVVNIALCSVLIPSLGLVGAAFANLANILVVCIYLVTVDKKILHIGLKRIVRDVWLGPLGIAALQGAIVYFFFLPLVSDKATLLFSLLMSIAIYYAISFLLRVFNEEDKYFFRQYLSLKLKELS